MLKLRSLLLLSKRVFKFACFFLRYRIIREEQFRYEVNEISWDRTGNLFAVTTGHGSVVFFEYANRLYKIID